MAGAPKRPTHTVVKAGLYYTPDKGETPVGTQLTLTKDQADKLGARGFVEKIQGSKTVDTSDADKEALAKAKADAGEKAKEVTALKKDVKVKDAEIKKLSDALEAKDKELTEANEALKTATGANG